MKPSLLSRARRRRREPPRPIGRIEAADAIVDARDAERERQRQLMDGIQVRLSEARTSLLDKMHARGAITRGELFTAQRVQALWRRLGLEASITGTLEPRVAASSQFGIERLNARQGQAFTAWVELMAACGRTALEVRRIARDEEPRDIELLRMGLQRAKGMV